MPGAANVKACQSVIAILNGGMGGADIPDGDRQGVYDHVAEHIRDSGATPAELKSAERAPRLASSLELRTRPLAGSDFVLRAATATSPPGFTGHAAVFNSRTAIGNPLTWGFLEQVASSAFDKTLKEGDARMLVDHDTALLVSRVSAGDLRLSTDKVGLATDSDLDQELSYVRDLTRNLETKRITGMSFGFRTIKDDWQTEQVEATDQKGNPMSVNVDVRTLLEVQLMEVSAVTFPAYEETDAGLRSAVVAIARRGDSELIDRRFGHPEFRSVFTELTFASPGRQPGKTTGAGSEPADRSTPEGEPETDATRDLELVQMRHRHLAASTRLGR